MEQVVGNRIWISESNWGSDPKVVEPPRMREISQTELDGTYFIPLDADPSS